MTFSPEILRLTRLAWGIALPVLFLLSIGLATIHATDRDDAPRQLIKGVPAAAAPPPTAESWLTQIRHAVGDYSARQTFFILTGVVLMLLTLLPSYQLIGRYAYLIYGIVVAMLLMLAADKWLSPYGIHVPLVPVKRATRRWIELAGFGLQPSEFMKVALVLCLARVLRWSENVREFRGLIVPFLLTLLPMAFIHFQPDLGTLLLLLPILFSMLWVAGARKRYLFGVVLLGAIAAPVAYKYFIHDYQKVRIDAVLRQEDDDERWHRKEGYQLRQAKTALGTGGLTGEGYAQGIFVEDDALLPERHNDFIFAMVGHQWGFVGATLVIVAYLIFMIVGVETAVITNDPFGRLLAVGLTVMILAQAVLNMGMIVGLLPVTGVTLPFVSYGGSSLWANFIAIGLLFNVAQRRPLLIAKKPFAYEEEE